MSGSGGGYTINLKHLAFIAGLGVTLATCIVMMERLGSGWMDTRIAPVQSRLDALETRLTAFAVKVDNDFQDERKLRVRQWDRYEAISDELQKLQLRFEQLTQSNERNTQFVERWYNTFRTLERHTRHEMQLKELEERFERLDRRDWHASVKRVGG